MGNDQAAADAAASAESAAAKNRSKVSSTRHLTPLEEVYNSLIFPLAQMTSSPDNRTHNFQAHFFMPFHVVLPFSSNS